MTRPLTGYEREIAILHHEANTDAELIEEFKGLLNRHKQAVARLRELHKPVRSYKGKDNTEVLGCIECEETGSGREYYVEYPCPTIQALDGDD
jgi:hypothetical protein